MSVTVAALYVETGGVYYGLPDVDPWDEERDARLYTGPHPVVAHPPCARWCRLAPLVEKVNGYKVGDDGGCFEAALFAVRRFGGVLEHPEASYAWQAFGLMRPKRRFGWLPADEQGGFTCAVDQGHYGHQARKATWLYAAHVRLPVLQTSRAAAGAYVTDGGGRIKRRGGIPRPGAKRLSGSRAAKTPEPFRDLLLDIARTAAR